MIPLQHYLAGRAPFEGHTSVVSQSYIRWEGGE